MSATDIVKFVGDVTIERRLRRLGSGAARQSALETGAIRGSQLYREHFAALHNSRGRSGGSGFYARASDLTFHRVVDDGIYLGTTQLGMRQRYRGGPIVPKRKYLTIPIHPDAWGKRARDSGLGPLVFIRPSGGGLYLAKAAGQGALIFYYMLVTSVNQPADPSVIPPHSETLRLVKVGIQQRYATLTQQPS